MQHLSFFPFFLVAGLVLACCSFLGYLPTVTIRQAFSMRSSESRPTQGPSFAQDESAVPSRSLMYQHTMRRTRSHHDLGIAMPELGTIARPTAAGLRGLRNSLDPPSDWSVRSINCSGAWPDPVSSFLQSVCPILGITLAQFFSINKFATNPVLSLLRNRGLPWGQTAAAFQTITTGSAAQFYISQGFPIGNDGHGIYAALEHFETQAIRENLVSGIVGGLSYPTTAGRHAIALQWVKNSKKVRVRELRKFLTSARFGLHYTQ